MLVVVDIRNTKNHLNRLEASRRKKQSKPFELIEWHYNPVHELLITSFQSQQSWDFLKGKAQRLWQMSKNDEIKEK